METNELLKKVRKIEIKTKGLSNQIFSGEYHSAFKGRGMSFSEVREYAYGDDIKAIDWNVTARFNTPYVKIFEEEREMTVMLLVDVSRSSFFGTHGQMKNELITEICAILAFSVINNNDKVGVIFFSHEIEKFIPPKKGKGHVLLIIRELLDFSYGEKSEQLKPLNLRKNKDTEKLSWWERLQNIVKPQKPIDPTSNETNLEQALKYLSNVIKRRSTAFVLSDFMAKDYEKALNLASRKHDLIGIRIYDAREAELPNVGLAYMTDAETGQTMWLDTSSEAVRQHYAERFKQNLEACKTAFAKGGADLVSIPTDDDYVKYLMNIFKKRGG